MSTIREVAKAAGVSPATVSHVLNGNTNFSTKPETRERSGRLSMIFNTFRSVPVPKRTKKKRAGTSELFCISP